MSRIIVIALAGLLAIQTNNSRAQSYSEAERAAVEELMSVMGADKMAAEVGNIMMTQMMTVAEAATKKPLPSPWKAVFVEESMRLFSERFPDLVDRMVPIYLKYLTVDEIKEISAFYKTATGRKMITVQGKMFSEGVTEGNEWGNEMYPVLKQRVTVRLKNEGYIQ